VKLRALCQFTLNLWKSGPLKTRPPTSFPTKSTTTHNHLELAPQRAALNNGGVPRSERNGVRRKGGRRWARQSRRINEPRRHHPLFAFRSRPEQSPICRPWPTTSRGRTTSKYKHTYLCYLQQCLLERASVLSYTIYSTPISQSPLTGARRNFPLPGLIRK
jgi:hypothetical protein